ISQGVNYMIPASTQDRISKSFTKPTAVALTKDQSKDAPAFDMIRASVNLMVAGVLISIATTMKLPLSTTYVTFMVAMGTSLADKAWGRESAVYRVAGVLNVIGGWFFTAFGAFVAAGVVVFLMQWNKEIMIPILLLLTALLLVRNYLSHKKKNLTTIDPKKLKKSESSTVQGIITESADNISNVVMRTNKIYSDILKGLAKEDSSKLKKSKKGVEKLDNEIEELRDNIFYLIKNMDETSVRGSSFYITILGYLTDMAQSLDYMSKKSYKHVNNNHKKLRFSQIKDLQEVDVALSAMLAEVGEIFDLRKFERISYVIARKGDIQDLIANKIKKQIEQTRTQESSPKNTTLYFNLLVESKDLVAGIMNLLEEYYESYKRE
ncbi:MAG: inorganic phosphate transporter, partial [Flavobacteriaceae bacterium]|nr:inorganic phosphate transporter [Flavobacteriaceae bacterium]